MQQGPAHRSRAPLVEIGQLLRHRCVLTTAIYAKVDIDACVALRCRGLRRCLDDHLPAHRARGVPQTRRGLGFGLRRDEKLLVQFLDHLDELGRTAFSVDDALAWAELPAGQRGLAGNAAVRGAASPPTCTLWMRQYR